MFCVFRSLLIFSFSFICFSCRFLFDFSRSPSQHASLLKCLLYLFISSFCSSSFHLFSFFCLLLCSRFFHLFSLFKLPFFWSFYYLYVSSCQTLCGKNLFKLLQNYFSSFHLKKTSFSLFPFLLGFFFMFFHVCSFSVSWKNGFSFL